MRGAGTPVLYMNMESKGNSTCTVFLIDSFVSASAVVSAPVCGVLQITAIKDNNSNNNEKYSKYSKYRNINFNKN